MVWQKIASERCYLVEFVIKLAERDFQQRLLHPDKKLEFNEFIYFIDLILCFTKNNKSIWVDF